MKKTNKVLLWGVIITSISQVMYMLGHGVRHAMIDASDSKEDYEKMIIDMEHSDPKLISWLIRKEREIGEMFTGFFRG